LKGTRIRAALLAAFLAVGCGGPDLTGEPPCRALAWDGKPRRANLVFVLADTLRRDALGIHGGAAHTPAFDAFAREHAWFARAVSQAPWTKPSIATLFTSLYPSQHRVTGAPVAELLAEFTGATRAPATEGLSAELTTLAEVFEAAGYRTGAIVANPWLERRLGFAQGFGSYDDSLIRWDQPGLDLSARALRWLEEGDAEAPFFLYLHYMDCHRPYAPVSLEEIAARRRELEGDPRPLSEANRRLIGRLVQLQGGGTAAAAGIPASRALLELAYHKGVESFDDALEALLAGLARHPARARTALVVTSDHGEALFARGWGNHGRGLHDDELGVPLVLDLPGVRAAESPIRCGAGLIDLLPTLCTYFGLDCPVPSFGQSLLAPPDGGGEGERFLVSEGVGNQPRHRAVRGRRYKLLYEPGAAGDGGRRESPWALYDLVEDPDEERDLLAPAPTERSRRVFDAFVPVLRESVPPYQPPEQPSVRLDEELELRLRALGYFE
jgi:arylsulfatase A-like enzyme